MNYNELSKAVESLSYRDKFRLAQLLIQLARKEEEEQYPSQRPTAASATTTTEKQELTSYVVERIKKLRPAKKETLLNSISAMFQFQGGISEQDRDQIVAELQKKQHIKIEANNRVSYFE